MRKLDPRSNVAKLFPSCRMSCPGGRWCGRWQRETRIGHFFGPSRSPRVTVAWQAASLGERSFDWQRRKDWVLCLRCAAWWEVESRVDRWHLTGADKERRSGRAEVEEVSLVLGLTPQLYLELRQTFVHRAPVGRWFGILWDRSISRAPIEAKCPHLDLLPQDW